METAVMYAKYNNPVGSTAYINVYEVETQESATVVMGVNQSSSNMGTQVEYMGEYRLELWSEVYGLVRAVDVNENTPQTSMDVGTLASGSYHLRLIVDGEVKHVSQMVVE